MQRHSNNIKFAHFQPAANATMIAGTNVDHLHELNFGIEEQHPTNVKVMPKEPFDVATFMPRNRDCRTLLPPDWQPGPTSVVIGRGKVCSTAKGNARLETVCKTFLDKYSKANSKLEKTTLVSRIVETVQATCERGAFVKFSHGRFWEVEDHSGKSRS